jgi:DNA-binding Lrp family transcriptional regulator
LAGNRLEKEIIGIFNNEITSVLSINQIAKKLKKAYPHINHKVNELIEEGILKKTVAGRSILCSINIENEKAVLLLSLNEIEKRERHSKRLSSELLEEISKIRKSFKVYTILIQNKCITFVLDHLYDKEAIKNGFSKIKEFELRFFSKDEFLETALKDNSLTSGQVILYSPATYFEFISQIKGELVMRAMFR